MTSIISSVDIFGRPKVNQLWDSYIVASLMRVCNRPVIIATELLEHSAVIPKPLTVNGKQQSSN